MTEMVMNQQKRCSRCNKSRAEGANIKWKRSYCDICQTAYSEEYRARKRKLAKAKRGRGKSHRAYVPSPRCEVATWLSNYGRTCSRPAKHQGTTRMALTHHFRLHEKADAEGSLPSGTLVKVCGPHLRSLGISEVAKP